MLILNAVDLRRALPMKDAIAAMRGAFAALSSGRAKVPLRTHLPVAHHDGVALIMPASIEEPDAEALAVKVLTIFQQNPARGEPLIQAAVLVLDPETGRPAALLEGGTLTALRTGAASGLATDLLARPDARVAAIFGAGVQGRTQLEAVCAVRDLETALVSDPSPEATARFIAELAGRDSIPAELRAATAREAAAEADILCTATVSPTPVFADADLASGAHVNAVGSYQPEVQELPPETVARARVFVDDREAVLAETGDLIQPIRAGLFGPEHIVADLGELVLGDASGRESATELTLFKSVGLAVQDAAAARAALARAKELGLGQRVEW